MKLANFFILLLILSFSRCTIIKKRYSNGYKVEWNKKYSYDNKGNIDSGSEISNTKSANDSLTDSNVYIEVEESIEDLPQLISESKEKHTEHFNTIQSSKNSNKRLFDKVLSSIKIDRTNNETKVEENDTAFSAGQILAYIGFLFSGLAIGLVLASIFLNVLELSLILLGVSIVFAYLFSLISLIVSVVTKKRYKNEFPILFTIACFVLGAVLSFVILALIGGVSTGIGALLIIILAPVLLLILLYLLYKYNTKM
jgi:hypothetical protein